jgi:hypothetical protein
MVAGTGNGVAARVTGLRVLLNDEEAPAGALPERPVRGGP